MNVPRLGSKADHQMSTEKNQVDNSQWLTRSGSVAYLLIKIAAYLAFSLGSIEVIVVAYQQF